MSEQSEADAMITRLAGLAQHDSAGNFSLDPARARLLLEKFRLPAAEYFMLHAVGAAVCSLATTVQITLRSDRFEVAFDGLPFREEDPEQCFSSLWSSERDPAQFRLRELAIAQGGAWDWGARHFRVTWRGGLQVLSVRRTGWTPALLRLLGPLGRQEQTNLLRQHLVPTPTCRLVLNGSPVQGLRLPERVVKISVLGGPSVQAIDSESSVEILRLREFPWLEPDELLFLQSAQGIFCELLPGESSPAMWHGTQDSALRSYWPGYLDLVLNGRLYRCALPPGRANCWGILWLTGLRRDLSHTFIGEQDLQLLFRFFAEALQREGRGYLGA